MHALGNIMALLLHPLFISQDADNIDNRSRYKKKPEEEQENPQEEEEDSDKEEHELDDDKDGGS